MSKRVNRLEKGIIKVLFLVLILFFISCGEDEKKEPCKDNPCVNIENSTCVEDGDSYNCDCNTGFHKDNMICKKDCNDAKTPSDIVLDADSCGELTACDESNDCNADERCESLAIKDKDYKKGCCVKGLRGCLSTGEVCEDEYDCSSSLCINRNEGVLYCSEKCTTEDNSCPSPISECADLYLFHACVKPKE